VNPDDELDCDDADADAGRLADEAHYDCGACGEEIVVDVDPAAGRNQEYVEDCPVCCRPHVIIVQVDRDGGVLLSARLE
jgi:hypothetical protein